MANTTPPMGNGEFVSFAGNLIQKDSKVHLNVGQEFIFTTDDKIRLCLTKHMSILEKRKAWTTPLGILITIIIIFPTTDFKQFIFKPETWQAFFLLSGVLSFVWLCYSIYQAGTSSSINDVVSDIKKSSGGLRFEIIKAEYWTQKERVDVTEVLRSMIVDNKLELVVSNDIKYDPDPGTKKKLTIEYLFNGVTLKKEYAERDKVLIP